MNRIHVGQIMQGCRSRLMRISQGFTLVELVVIMSIILIIGMTSFGSFGKFSDQNELRATKSALASFLDKDLRKTYSLENNDISELTITRGSSVLKRLTQYSMDTPILSFGTYDGAFSSGSVQVGVSGSGESYRVLGEFGKNNFLSYNGVMSGSVQFLFGSGLLDSTNATFNVSLFDGITSSKKATLEFFLLSPPSRREEVPISPVISQIFDPITHQTFDTLILARRRSPLTIEVWTGGVRSELTQAEVTVDWKGNQAIFEITK